MTEIPCLFKSKPGYVRIIIGILGSIFFGFLIHLMYVSKLIDKSAGVSIANTIGVLFLSFFCFFAVGLAWMALSCRIFELTESELIINHPFLLFKSQIFLADIEKLNEGDYKLNMVDNHSLTLETTAIYNGRKITLNLKNGKQIKLDSFEVGGYKSLVVNLKKQLLNIKNHHK
jgi:hypothetical protein